MKRRDRLLSGPGAMAVLAIVLVACTLLSFLFGRYPVPFSELCGILWNKFLSIFGAGTDKFWTDAMEAAVWNVRLPRVLMSVLVGACLSAAGAAYQGVFQNPMAAPDVLGASAGAGFGAALAIYVGLSSAYITLAAFGMSLLTVVLVFWVSKHAKGERVLGLVLAGIMVSSLFQAGTSFIKLAADPTNKLPQITYWLMGSLSGMDWEDLGFVIWPMLIGLVPLFLLRWRLNVLAMGDDEARAMGVDAGRLRIWLIIAATLVTGGLRLRLRHDRLGRPRHTAHGPAHLRLGLPLAHARLHAGRRHFPAHSGQPLEEHLDLGHTDRHTHGLRRRALLPPAHNGKG